MNPTKETHMTHTPTPALPLLDELDELRAKATPGPWRPAQVVMPGYWGETDAALIVAEHNAVPKLTAALRAVLQLADDRTPEGSWVVRAKLRAAITTALEAS